MIHAHDTTDVCVLVHAKQREFDHALIRLQERYERFTKAAYHDLTPDEREALTLLECDNDTLLRHDQEVLRDHALARGIDLGKDAYKKRAPVIYMGRLLVTLRYMSLEDVYREYPQLKNGADVCAAENREALPGEGRQS